MRAGGGVRAPRFPEVALDLSLEGQIEISLSDNGEKAFQAEGTASAKIRTREASCWMWIESRYEKRGGWNVVRRWQLPLRGPQESLKADAGKIRNCGGMGVGWGRKPGNRGGLRWGGLGRRGWTGELVKK